MIECAEACNKPICATGDLHYVRKEQHIAREVFISIPAIGGGFHPLYDGKNRIKEYPYQEFKTTNQMLDAFDWLGKEKAYEFVVTNPNKIADMVEDLHPLKEGTYPPHLDNVENDKVFHKEQEVIWICRNCGHVYYGKDALKVCPVCKHPES